MRWGGLRFFDGILLVAVYIFIFLFTRGAVASARGGIAVSVVCFGWLLSEAALLTHHWTAARASTPGCVRTTSCARAMCHTSRDIQNIVFIWKARQRREIISKDSSLRGFEKQTERKKEEKNVPDVPLCSPFVAGDQNLDNGAYFERGRHSLIGPSRPAVDSNRGLCVVVHKSPSCCWEAMLWRIAWWPSPRQAMARSRGPGGPPPQGPWWRWAWSSSPPARPWDRRRCASSGWGCIGSPTPAPPPCTGQPSRPWAGGRVGAAVRSRGSVLPPTCPPTWACRLPPACPATAASGLPARLTATRRARATLWLSEGKLLSLRVRLRVITAPGLSSQRVNARCSTVVIRGTLLFLFFNFFFLQ